jgi:hypothetical protein
VIDLTAPSLFNREIAATDLREYVESNGLTLCEMAEDVFVAAENAGSRLNVNLYPGVFLLALIERIPKLRALMMRHGLSPEDAIEDLEQHLGDGGYDSYASPFVYSSDTNSSACRQIVIDGAMDAARKKRRKQVRAADVLEAVLEYHDEDYPLIENGVWTDMRLHVPFNTLSHILGEFHGSLWLTFDDIRRALDMISPSAARRIPVRQAPQRLRSAVRSLLSEHPDYFANCFIIMPFHGTQFHRETAASLRKILRELGINPLRADDKTYCEDVMANIETYLYGCRFAVAVHDRHLSNAHNPNVAMEVGYCMGMKKPLCLLKEKTVQTLPSDLQGRIYVPFDGERIEETLRVALMKWLSDNGIHAKREI